MIVLKWLFRDKRIALLAILLLKAITWTAIRLETHAKT